jgi:riboflavin kinase/FMN adenylyltransferase
MLVIDQAEQFPTVNKPILLSIGTFDGVHLGHQAVLQYLSQQKKATDGHSVVLTFSNHPLSVLRPDSPTKLICATAHKLLLLQQHDVDTTLLIPFTKEFSKQSPEQFLTDLRKYIPFTHLVLGHDAVIGHNRQGDRSILTQLGQKMGFEVTHLPPAQADGKPVSSTAIRTAIQSGSISDTSRLLGRPYSVRGVVIRGMGKGKQLGFPTANIDVKDLCLPPYGIYAASMLHKGKRYPGVISLGVAPTVRKNPNPVLETHLFDFSDDLYGQEVEVFFGTYIRPEMKFSSVDELQTQIARDVEHCRALLQQKSNVIT